MHFHLTNEKLRHRKERAFNDVSELEVLELVLGWSWLPPENCYVAMGISVVPATYEAEWVFFVCKGPFSFFLFSYPSSLERGELGTEE